jgi:phospholipid transport system substrate-binding protein
MRKIAFRSWWTLGLAGLLVVCLAAAPRGAAAQDAKGFIADLGAKAIAVSGPNVPPAQRAARFRDLLDGDFDLAGIARFVLGPYGRSMAPPQRQEFMAVFRDSLAQTYTERLGRYAGEPFRVTGSRPAGDEAVVTSEVMRQGGKPLEIDWNVADRNGHFLVTDVALDGVSMKASQRSAFAGIIQRNGGRPDTLVAVLRQQLPRAP